MARKLTIVMYHYVRDLTRSRFPNIKGRTVEDFEGQLDYLQKNYTIISPEQFLAHVKGGEATPDNGALLTFDDGYLEHFSTVFPILRRRGLAALFFPPACCVLERRVLDVNKIQFSLAANSGHDRMAEALCKWIDDHRDTLDVDSAETYWNANAQASRFDPPETAFIKRMLQKSLPPPARAAAVEWLFETFCGIEEPVLANELYVTADQLTLMIQDGMYVGSHGNEHVWLDTLGPTEQAMEVDAALRFLVDLGTPSEDWIMCYPYGASNESLLEILAARSCAAAFTTEVAVADLDADSPFLLPRLDTNDLALEA